MPTSLTTRLGLALPILQGPMTGSDTPALVAAVSEAGGLGVLGCGMRSPTAMAAVAAEVRERTGKPFGMNLFVQSTPQPDEATVTRALERLAPFYAEFGLVPERPAQWCEDFEAQFEALIAARPAVASFTFGILTAEQVARLQAVGSVVIGTATTVAEAQAWAAVGADAVCASGMEAGGHRGTFLTLTQPAADTGTPPSLADFEASMVGTLTLVTQCVDVLSIPVIAAGGIMDGRGIAGALALGAQGVQMGTAFLSCPESGISAPYREALTRAGTTATDTRTTRIFSGRPARGIVNTMMEQLRADEAAVPPYPVQNALTGALRRASAQAGRADHVSLWAGQGVAKVRPLPAAALVALLAQEWQTAMAAITSKSEPQ
ncbi:MAG: nitronate monooxygenase [Gammaproteobacteria bacterium]|nr:nitronate monooxygenase [Gammaproteobacteria bacterium]MBU1507896.1 nitronate monooxygenase [Gammaproteobacteria bacterium]MBU2121394.1 nitronate monooxygenase [Gammaproteobacteria bacterium]MBU2172255.1 nitronate monooxygenase [Gammaproteobacteria bacterium]MBU2200281.1 nitronate monooxygenase [Gammaproteobacteria bacterium]